MIRPDELIIDNFAGGGGASTGIAWALGRSPDVAINHDPEAMAMHAANHPATAHLCQNVWKADPRAVCSGRPVGLAWFSPDCKHFSKAKGGQPVKRNIRDLAWVVIHWAKLVKPRIIALENVEEFKDWGPLVETDDGKFVPCPLQRGLTFKRWVRELKKLGYAVEWRELRACDYGAPTIRKRLFLVARCDGQPIVWPSPTHGPGRLPYRTAAECIDWSIPCPSIFERERPLAEATLRRIARGIQRYVIDAAEPFIVPVKTWGGGGNEAASINDPLRTVTASKRGEHALVAPFFAPRYGERPGQDPRCQAADVPMATIVPTANGAQLVAASLVKQNYGDKPCQGADEALHTVTTQGNKFGLVAAFMAQHNGGMVGHPIDKPLSTIVQRGTTQAIVTSNLIKLRNNCIGQPVDDPLHTITAGSKGSSHFAEVRAFLVKYFETAIGQSVRGPLHIATAKARFGLVQVQGQDYQIVDIGMRMLTPRELFRAQGFGDDYIIAPEHDGKPLTKTAQIRMCGNSVAPQVARAVIAANLGIEAPIAREAAE